MCKTDWTINYNLFSQEFFHDKTWRNLLIWKFVLYPVPTLREAGSISRTSLNSDLLSVRSLTNLPPLSPFFSTFDVLVGCFAKQINWLVSIWWENWSLKELMSKRQKNDLYRTCNIYMYFIRVVYLRKTIGWKKGKKLFQVA